MNKQTLAILLTALILTLPLAGKTTIKNYTLIINQKKVILETPAIREQNHILVPIRDTLSKLKGKLTFRRKDQSYKLSLKNISKEIILIPQSREYWIGNTKHYLPIKTQTINNRLYVPIEALYKNIGLKVTKQTNKLTISNGSHNTTKPYKSSHKEGLLASTQTSPPKTSYSGKLPQFYENEPIYVTIGVDNFPIQKFFYKNNILYVDLLPTLKKQGYTLTKLKTGYKLAVNNQQFTFKTNSTKLTHTLKKHKSTTTLSAPPIQKNNTIYVPLQSFTNAIGYDIKWDKNNQSITFLSKIQKVLLIKEGHALKLKVYTSNPITPQYPEELFWKKGFYIDIPNSTPSFVTKTLKVSNPYIDTIKAKSVDASTTRITVKLKENISYLPMKKTSYGGLLEFSSAIDTLTEKTNYNNHIVTIKGNSAFTHTLWEDKKKKIIVIDIPNMINGLPQVTRSKSPIYHRIRSSQFKLSPPQTRLVIDLKHTTKYTLSKPNKNTLILSFNKTKQAPVITKASKRSPLKNKVIFIDPGHGGNDPGAVLRRTIYEKTYTLDISKRLQRRLQAQGAYVIMARKGDENPSLRARSYMANKNKADALVSIHVNSFVNNKAYGTETYYYKHSDKQLSRHIHKQLVKSLKLKNNGLKRSRMYILNHTKMPGTLVEPLFMTRPSEFRLLNTKAGRQKIADAIYRGLYNYFKSK